MRTSSIIVIVFLLFSFKKENPAKKDPVSILFIGNSLTYYHDMPATLQKMFDIAGVNFKVSQSTCPGQSLAGHMQSMVDSISQGMAFGHMKGPGDTTETEKLLYNKKWDYIVLQEGTVRFLIPEVKIYDVIPAIKEIKNKVKNPKTTFILFKTWASLDSFPKQYCYPSCVAGNIKRLSCCSPHIKSYEEEAWLINSCSDSVALATGLKTVPVTDCFLEIVRSFPKINLFEDEDSHPSESGSYLIAAVFYKYFTKRKATTIKYFAGVNESTAIIIQKVADKKFP